MPLHAFTPKPAELLEKLKKAVTFKHVPAWGMDADGDFTYVAEAGRWKDMAWMKARIGTGELVFAFVIPTNAKNTATLYSVYHGRFAEMLLTHFSSHLTEIKVTPF